MNPLLILRSGPGDPAWNMALDEALLATSQARARPVLRFYAWTLPAATFGYSQRYREVSRQTRLRPLIRRPTGGGLVPHDRDWTYSLAVPPGHPWHALRARDSYRRMHQWIADAFQSMAIATELATAPHRPVLGQCFVGHEEFDVLCGGRKIAGAAQRRNRLGLLIQGSVQPPPQADRARWEERMIRLAPPDFFPSTASADELPAAMEEARRLSNERYGRPEFHTAR